jgi:hypothetical protein
MCPVTALHLQSGMFPSRTLGWHVPHDSITPTEWHVHQQNIRLAYAPCQHYTYRVACFLAEH